MEDKKLLTEEKKESLRFNTIDSVTLFDKQLRSRKFTVQQILPEGLVLLAGSAKIGKSFFVLDLCASVAKGEPFLGYPTKQGTVLYLCFEDDEKRIQERQFGLMDEGVPNLYFSNDATTLRKGVIEKMENFVTDHPDTQLIVLDTFVFVRDTDNGANVYEKDYKDIIPFHEFTQRHNLTVILVHHTNKKTDGDEYNQASGSTGLTGAVDDYFLLKRLKRGERKAKLFISGRDVDVLELELQQGDNGFWSVAGENNITEKGINLTVKCVFLFLSWHSDLATTFEITATELSAKLKDCFSVDIPSNMITKNLTAHHDELEELGMKFEPVRTKTSRLLRFTKTDSYKLPYLCFGENGAYVAEIFFSDESELDDGGDGVTAENTRINFVPSADNLPQCDGLESNTGAGETSCQPVNRDEREKTENYEKTEPTDF